MRIGIVSNDSRQVYDLVEEFRGLDLLWVAGDLQGAELDYPVFKDFYQALTEQAVDLVIDCVGNLQSTEAMVVPLAAAVFLLGIGKPSYALVTTDAALTDSAGQLFLTIDKIARLVERLDNHAGQLAQVGEKLDSVTQGILGELERTSRILDVITRIAKRSKIIGLNSAIEAARVGELGRGFAVVAEEIKSLADDSSQSVQDIAKILNGIQRSSDELAQRTGFVQEVSDLQQQTTREISAMLQALKELGGHLRQLAEQPA